MYVDAWLTRLSRQLPGWHVWYSSLSPRWNAVPADDGTRHAEALRLPNKVSAATPQELRTLARERYGWHDICESCGVPARECGHRQPERRVSP